MTGRTLLIVASLVAVLLMVCLPAAGQPPVGAGQQWDSLRGIYVPRLTYEGASYYSGVTPPYPNPSYYPWAYGAYGGYGVSYVPFRSNFGGVLKYPNGGMSTYGPYIYDGLGASYHSQAALQQALGAGNCCQ